MNYYVYTTVAKVKTLSDILATTSDALILDMIRQASKEINDISNRSYDPMIATRLYDTPGQKNKYIYQTYVPDLLLDADLLSLTTLTNGDGTVITSTDYKLYPLNSTPKNKMTLLHTHYVWQPDTNGNPNGAISLNGIWGYHEDYGDAWDTVTTLSTAITTAGQTTVTVPTGTIAAGDFLKIDSEFIYVKSVAVSTTDTITMDRGVNGSTATTHLISAPVYRWAPMPDVEMLTRRAAVAYTKLRANPIGETINVDGITYSTPKDVNKWIDGQLATLGLIRTGMG